MNKPLMLAVLFVFVLGATALFGPLAACLVELFPTRVRYTALSLPYHIGTGWVGGFVPFFAFAIVTAVGNIYAGLWYPVFFTLISVLTTACSCCPRPRTGEALVTPLLLSSRPKRRRAGPGGDETLCRPPLGPGQPLPRQGLGILGSLGCSRQGLDPRRQACTAGSTAWVIRRTIWRPSRANCTRCSASAFDGSSRSTSRRAILTISGSASLVGDQHVGRAQGPQRAQGQEVGWTLAGDEAHETLAGRALGQGLAEQLAGLFHVALASGLGGLAQHRVAQEGPALVQGGQGAAHLILELRSRAATRPVPSGTWASMSLRSMVASTGAEPPVPTAATTSPRSITAGVLKSHSAGLSTTLTSTRAARAAPAAAWTNTSSSLATKASTAPA
jgi:hypothetical protein